MQNELKKDSFDKRNYPERMVSYQEYIKQDMYAQRIILARNCTECINYMNFKYLDQCKIPDKFIYFERLLFRDENRIKMLIPTIDVIRINQVANQFIEKSFFYSLYIDRDTYIDKKTLNKSYSYKEWRKEEEKLFSEFGKILKYIKLKVNQGFQKYLIAQENKYFDDTLSLFTEKEIQLAKEFKVNLELLHSSELYFVLWEIRSVYNLDFLLWDDKQYIYLDRELVVQAKMTCRERVERQVAS